MSAIAFSWIFINQYINTMYGLLWLFSFQNRARDMSQVVKSRHAVPPLVYTASLLFKSS